MATSSSSSVPNSPPSHNNLPADPLLAPGSVIDSESTLIAAPVRPSWLPEGWTMETNIRKSGKTVGSTDRYFFEPGTGQRFRSKKEVEYYLQTGMKRQKTDAAAAADAQPSQSPVAGKKKKKSGSQSKKGGPTLPPVKYDPRDVPEMVEWRYVPSSEEAIPFIDGKRVPKSVRQGWEAELESYFK